MKSASVLHYFTLNDTLSLNTNIMAFLRKNFIYRNPPPYGSSGGLCFPLLKRRKVFSIFGRASQLHVLKKKLSYLCLNWTRINNPSKENYTQCTVNQHKILI